MIPTIVDLYLDRTAVIPEISAAAKGLSLTMVQAMWRYWM
jgi:hypothetical protein